MRLRTALAENLVRLRAERGWSQEDFADKVGIDRTYVSSLERRRYAATVDILERLADAFQIDATDLLRSSSAKNPGSGVVADDAVSVTDRPPA